MKFWLLLLALTPVLLQAQVGRKPARPKVLRPNGPEWKVIRANCTRCHGIDDYAFYAQDHKGWDDLLLAKHKGPGGYPIAEGDKKVLLDWLVAKFGPETKPFPRTYIPPEITTFFSDPEAHRLLDRACTKCHPVSRIEQSRNAEERWRALAVDMRERGAVLNDEELEQLVEWLTRVWGTNENK